MATTTTAQTLTDYTVVEPVDEAGTCTIHERPSGTAYHVVDYADSIVREKLSTKSVGEHVRLDLAPADPDGLDWIATRVRPGVSTTVGPSGT